MKMKATTWLAQIVAVAVLLATGTASASNGLLVGNSCLGKNTLEGGFHRGLASVSGEACRGCGEFCEFDAAEFFVAPLQNGGVLNGARYAQTSYSNTFSAEGIRIYSRLAGRPINTIDELVAAIRAGHINPADIPVNYIVRPGGNTLILNTRTAQALEQAGIPRSQWNVVNQTGDPLFERLLSEQLQRNNLTNRGTANPVLDGGR